MKTSLSVLEIISTRGPDDEPVCELAWEGHRWYAPVAEVRAAALDLLTCAAYAEMIRHLMATLNLDAPTATMLMSDMLSQLRSAEFGTPATVTLMPAVSKPAGPAKHRQALVLIRRDRSARGTWDGEVDAFEARKMAVRFLEAAEATESDQVVSEALRAAGIGQAQQDTIFGYLQQLRR